MTGYVATIGRHAAVLSPISAGHFMSHMYHTCLPILFLVLSAACGGFPETRAGGASAHPVPRFCPS